MADQQDPNASDGQRTPDAGQNGDGATDDGAAGGTPATFAEWLESHGDESAKSLYATDVAGLKKALDTERNKNKTLAGQLRDAAKGADEETAKKLNALATERDAAVQRADFYASATAAGCINVDAAWHVAKGEDMFDSGGRPNIEALRAKVPEFFRAAPAGSANAGAGTGSRKPSSASMNDLIREAARG